MDEIRVCICMENYIAHARADGCDCLLGIHHTITACANKNRMRNDQIKLPLVCVDYCFLVACILWRLCLFFMENNTSSY